MSIKINLGENCKLNHLQQNEEILSRYKAVAQWIPKKGNFYLLMHQKLKLNWKIYLTYNYLIGKKSQSLIIF